MEWPPSHEPITLPAKGQRLPCQIFLHPQSTTFSTFHTGNSAFLRPPPALSSAWCMYGPTTGMFPANPPTVEKKSPNSTNIPYNSIKKPTEGHRKSISVMPAANATVPFSFWRRAKNAAVFCSPIIRVRPKRKSICSGTINRVLSEKRRLIHCPWPACLTWAVLLMHRGIPKDAHGSIEKHDHSSH